MPVPSPDAALGVADLVGVGLSDGEVGSVDGRIRDGVGGQDLFLVHATGLRFVEGTPRESEVLAELATGGSNRAVAQRLVLTQRAVEKYINSIFAKLGLTGDDSVDRRVKAVLMFLEDGAIRRGCAE